MLVTSNVLIKVKKRWINTIRVAFLNKLRLKYFCKPEAYFQPSWTSEMEFFAKTVNS